MCADILDKGYEPAEVENRWYEYWQREGLFRADDTSGAPAYAIVIPPPNVTGVLHMGHALNNTIQDILCRYRRLKGDNVLWMPGTDHAGIATQNVVERQLAAEGRSRHEVGREEFIERVWQWKHQSGSAIINQLKRLGASCDWDRERFTMDAGLSTAVRKVFVDLYHAGLIYQGNYIINWCHRCHTALADLEVEHEEKDGALYHIRYPFAEGDGGIVVATTRPETMLGDTAVAVNPEDDRYRDIPSEAVILPLMNRRIPIIRDSYVDMSFGTGGLKVTPAHDPNDFEIGRRHNLPELKVISDDGLMSEEAGPYAGMDRIDCRKAVVAALEAEGALVKIEPYKHSVGHCYRCKEVVEPNLSKQWFVKAKPLADQAMAAVNAGKTRIIPEMWVKTYFDWLENIRDWCISRQIWWGHQIPAWTCDACEKMVVAMEAPTACPDCGSEKMTQDTDVLDTWFSSALWPFSTMGWPEETPLLKTFYPTACLVTGFDILFFWVARMMMMGLQFMGDVPFKDVYVHALVRDEEGKKMSKSKGNVIDPLVIIDQYGTDAFRFTLTAFAVMGRDVKMSERRVEGYRHFVNKLWNAARFSLMHLNQAGQEITAAQPLSLPDRWILSRLKGVVDTVEAAIEGYKFNEAAGTLYNFIWHEFCDWYLEAIKPILYNDDVGPRQLTLNVLWRVLRDTLILLHPIMPFVTEEIWHKLPGTEGSIMRARFPQTGGGVVTDPAAESDMQLVIDIISAVRNIRGEMNLPPSRALNVRLQSQDAVQRESVERHLGLFQNLAKIGEFKIEQTGAKPKSAAAAIVSGATVLVDLHGIIDFDMEAARLEKEIAKIEKELGGLDKKLANRGFLEKAPEEVVAGVHEKHTALSEKKTKLQHNLDMIRDMAG